MAQVTGNEKNNFTAKNRRFKKAGYACANSRYPLPFGAAIFGYEANHENILKTTRL